MRKINSAKPIRWDLVIGLLGLVIGIIALFPSTPTPKNCDLLKNNIITTLQDLKSESKSITEDELKIEKNKTFQKYHKNDLELLEGFINEQAIAKEMKSFAQMILDVEKKHIKKFGENSISRNHSSFDFYEQSLTDAGYPRIVNRKEKRHLFQGFGLNSDIYMIFDFTPTSHEQIDKLTTALYKAANGLGKYSERMWRLGGWDAKYLNFGAAIDIENIKKGIDELSTTSKLFKKKRLNSISEVTKLETRLEGFKIAFTNRECTGNFPTQVN